MTNPDDRSLEVLTARLAAAGCHQPVSWARSEIDEDIAQTTRFLFLAATWRNMQQAVAHGLSTPEGHAVLDAGADREAVTALLQRTLGMLAHNVLYLLDEPEGSRWRSEEGKLVSDVAPDDRRWQLVEVAEDGTLTGRDVGGLHESIGDTDPAGQEGEGWLY